MAIKNHINTLTDLLLGAAYADKRLEGHEIEAIGNLIAKVLGEEKVPAAQEARFKEFNPAKFDLKEAGGSLSSLSQDDKIKVLDLIASVNEADDVIDMDEDAYLRKVALAMGLSNDDIQGMTIEILEGDALEGLLGQDT
jgi:uncharacterized tellurite resistance protein B-like protein